MSDLHGKERQEFNLICIHLDLSARTSVSQFDDGEDLLKKSMQNLQEKCK